MQIVSGENSLGTVIMAGEPGWTVFYRGLAAVEVKEGEIVKQGSLLGTLGPPRFYDLPHLHFELRYEGRPVAPPADWVACFTSSGAPPDSPAI